MSKFIIKTLGCKVNQCESEAISRSMASDRHTHANKNETADIVIINTCTVTQKASMQSRQAVRRAIRTHPDAKIIVTGCYAQTEPEAFEQIQGVHAIVGNTDKNRIAESFLSSPLSKEPSRPLTIAGDIFKHNEFDQFPAYAYGSRTRPFLKIQDGCNAFCTYCIVPYARGKSRSLSPDKVMDQLAELGEKGYREVVLTGIHIGCYGLDLHPRTDLYSLLAAIKDKGAIDRIRISSIEPAELTPAIIELSAQDNDGGTAICRHFHIPLQSGDNTILNKMHRPYDRDLFKDLVHHIRKTVPDAAIGVDTLIGFPGETDAAFENTWSLIHELPVSYLHVFPFSPRKGTPAFSYPDKVPEHIIKARCKKMRTLGEEKRAAFYRSQIGRTCQVLIEEKRDRETGLLKGFSSNYIPVRLSGRDSLCNTQQSVKITHIKDGTIPMGTLAI